MSVSLSVSGASNAFARVARAKKVAALVEYFDGILSRTSAQRGDAATAMLVELRKFDQLAWFAHALAAGQRKPSPDTQAGVIATYERRTVSL